MGATPDEEIARQHAEAVAFVDAHPPFAPNVDRGEISLGWKRHPTVACKWNSEKISIRGERWDKGCVDSADGTDNVGSHGATEETNETTGTPEVQNAVVGENSQQEGDLAGTEIPPCISSRGFVNITPLADLVREGFNDSIRFPGGIDAASKASNYTSTTHGSRKTVKETRNGKTLSNTTAETKDKSKALPNLVLRQPVDSLTNLWCQNNAAQNNVHVIRPSHDAWGIKKICLIFCDDFLRDVYEMPWWHLNQKMRLAINPILETLSVPPNRLVRLLLAALPPGVTIPVHHDTGEWVRHTHRVHVPVIVKDPDRVIFRCGLTEEQMDRVDLRPGHVFEMNNQAKHAVSNCSTENRVHLILDYVDELYQIQRRIQLKPGERLLQTRRTIDRESDAGTRPTPSFLIIGAQKCGTTSLYDYLNQHPLIVKARRRETHNLDWRWNDKAKTSAQRKEHCLKFFYSKELHLHSSCMTGDSTPSYLLDSLRVIPRLKEVYPHPKKIFVMLRDPVKRAYSHYSMVTSHDGTPEQIKNRGTEWRHLSFEEVMLNDIKNMKEDGLIPYWEEKTNTIDQDVFEKFVGSAKEATAWENYLSKRIPLNTGSHSLLSRGMYELNLRPWLQSFPKEEIVVFKLEDMSAKGGVQRTLNAALDHLKLPHFEVQDKSAKNTRDYNPISEVSKNILIKFYDPHNKRLEKILGEEWIDPWPYK